MSAVSQIIGELKVLTGNALARKGSRSATHNSIYSVVDYLSQPAAMLIATPYLLHRLGASQYGIWMIVVAVVGSLGMVGSGFGDATVKYVSEFRGKGDREGVERVIRSTLTIHCVLALALGIVLYAGATFAANRIFKVEPELVSAAKWSLRVAGLLLVLRSIESVFISTLRAFENYAATVRVSIFTRLSTIAIAVLLAYVGGGVVSVVVGCVVVALVGVVLQGIAVRTVVGQVRLLPSFHLDSLAMVFAFGCFSWMQGLAAVTFSHADRLIVAALLGTEAVAYFTICVQAAQMIHGLTSAAFNFIFPYVSSRYAAGDKAAPQRAFVLGFFANVVLTLAVAMPLAMFSERILTLWMGAEFAARAHSLLSLLAIAFGILSVNVVPHYLLLAIGKVRFVSMVNILAGTVGLIGAAVLTPKIGLFGAAVGRMLYGPVVALNFFAVYTYLFRGNKSGVQES